MIRPAIPADLAAVLRISKASFHGEDAFGAGWLVRELAKPGTSLVVDDAAAGIIRGYLLLQSHPNGTVVRLVATCPEHRQCGVGKVLLATVRGPAFTWVRTDNLASLGLFAAMLWREAEPPRKRRDWRYLSLDPRVE